jgi:phosphonatase-like hydrolase
MIVMNFDLVVFDIAGTTVNDEDSVNRCVRGALEAVGVLVTAAQVNAVMGLPKPIALAELIAGSPLRDNLKDGVPEIHRDFVKRTIRFYESDPSVFEVPGATGTFQALRAAGIKVALDTGFDRQITDVILGRLKWNDLKLIDASVTSDEVARGRPYPDMIARLMNRFNLTDPSRVVKVGDTPADIEEGKNAGCGVVVGVTRGTHTREQLETSAPTYLIETVAELPRLLGLTVSS